MRTLGSSPSITATHEFVVPRSMPMILDMVTGPQALPHHRGRRARPAEPGEEQEAVEPCADPERGIGRVAADRDGNRRHAEDQTRTHEHLPRLRNAQSRQKAQLVAQITRQSEARPHDAATPHADPEAKSRPDEPGEDARVGRPRGPQRWHPHRGQPELEQHLVAPDQHVVERDVQRIAAKEDHDRPERIADRTQHPGHVHHQIHRDRAEAHDLEILDGDAQLLALEPQPAAHRRGQDIEEHAQHDSERQRQLERQVGGPMGTCPISTPHALRDERDRPHRETVAQDHREEVDRPRDVHAAYGVFAELPDDRQVDQVEGRMRGHTQSQRQPEAERTPENRSAVQVGFHAGGC
jgi:hypothetical protein